LARIHLDRETFSRIMAYLARPLAVRVAAADIGVKEVTLARIVRELRAWLLELDPTGTEEAKVKLGGHVLSPHGRPPRQPEAIDVVLTRAIDGAVQALRSRRDTPVPAHCPYCESSRVRLRQRANSYAPLPVYRCMTCRRDFNRLTGTPLARSRWPEKQREFVRYLGIPMQLTEAAERLSVDYGTVRDWRERYSALVAQIDPSGALADRMRISPAVTGQPCGNCGRVDALAWEETRRWHCAGCGRFLATGRAAG
jgi:transposase-like protein